MAHITFVGGGSYLWMPSILTRLLQTPSFQGDSITLMDVSAEAGEDIYQLAVALRDRFKSTVKIARTTDIDAALAGADYVSLTISTGGFEAMRVDVETPEKYGIYHTVGDTVGPGGLSRALRNVPVVLDLARRMERQCPGAWLLNLTNPLTPLTRAVSKHTKIKTVGLCQGVVEHVAYLARLLGEPIASSVPNRQIQFTTAGIDHCPWLLELKVNGQDGLQRLRDMGLCSSDLREGQIKDSKDTYLDQTTGNRAAFAIWNETGYLPGISDRHVIENFGCFVTDKQEMARYGIVRTSIADRLKRKEQSKQRVRALIRNPEELKIGATHTHAQVCEMIDALEGRGDCITTLNVENVGQIPELPAGANVETLCQIDRLGVHPLTIGQPWPRVLDAIVRPHIMRHEGIIDAAMSGDFELAVNLLATDPLVRRISDARAMMKEMIVLNKAYLPRFKHVWDSAA